MITIRNAVPEDVPAMTLLMHDLGYPTTGDEMKTRFENINCHKDYRTLLAITADHEVAGMIGLIKNYFFEHTGSYIRIGALVVGENYRNRGIGKLLLTEAENWAAEVGASAILVNSAKKDERIAAYAFYQHLGYVIKSSGFVKQLNQ